MKQFNKTLLAASVAAVAMGSTAVQAAWTTNANTAAVINQGQAAAKSAVATAANPVYTLAGGESLTINDTVVVDLTGGATFSTTTPTMTCDTGDLGAGVGTAAVPLTGGTAGSTSATWRAIDGLCAAGSTLALNAGALTAYDVSGVTGNADFLLTLTTSTGVTIGTANHSVAAEVTPPPAAPTYPFTASNLLTASAATVSTGNTAQVTSAYTLFGTPNTTVTSNATLTMTANTTGSIPTANVAVNNMVYTVSGDLSGVTTVTATGLTATTLGAGFFDIATDKLSAVASNAAALGAGASLVVNDLAVTIDGTSTQAARTLTLAVELTGDANWTGYTAYPAAAAVSITRNGTFFTSSSTGPLNDVKITDTSGSASTSGGQITVTAFDANGLAVLAAAGAPALPAAVVSNGTVTMPGADLVANYPGAVRFDFVVNTISASVANVKKTSTGTNLTVYGNGTGGVL